MAGEYDDHARAMRNKLNAVSPSLCIAKWAQVSINLPAGLTQSCYHPPTHPIPLVELTANPAALHNTKFKIHERKDMLEGKRPSGCSYCWKIEDAEGNHLSDRSYRSSEWWAAPEFNTLADTVETATPRYVEVNFNQACNFKCMYCSPHLSTTWEEEIRKSGPYEVNGQQHNNIDAIKHLMPLKVANKDNPYVQAFWEWWPEIYRKLRVFRMTGGEPLMDKNTFKVLEYVNENPHGQLELSITSNLCPPDQKLFDRFMTLVKKLEEVRTWEDKDNFNENSGNNWYVAPTFKHFTLFVSLDGVGEQAEYMRHGLNYEQLMNNIRTYLRETHHTSISFINTFNLLSIPSLHKFLEMILELRVEFGGRVQEQRVVGETEHNGYVSPAYKIPKFQRIWFDVPLLESPAWFQIQNARQSEIDEMLRCIRFMEENVQGDDYLETFTGFKPYEILKLDRNLALAKQSVTPEKAQLNKSAFYQFVSELDIRRNTNFVDIFPELADYYNDAKRKHFQR